MSSGCALDFDAKRREREPDASLADGAADAASVRDDARADDGEREAGSTPTDAGEDAALRVDDAGVPGGDGSAPDDGIDECALGSHDCPPVYPCFDTAHGYTCLGRSADWPLPVRNTTGSPESRGLHVDVVRGVIYDDMTGLEWQRRTSSSVLPPERANEPCAGLNIAAESGWRLPGVAELHSLRPVPPDVPWDQNALPSFLSEPWLWTSASGETGRFGTNPLLGTIGQAVPGDADAVLCVRTREARFDRPPAQRFSTDLVANTVTDQATKLTWERTVAGERWSLSEATAHCAALDADKPYRLPRPIELMSVLDFAGRGTLLAPWLGNDTAQSFFWTSEDTVDTNDASQRVSGVFIFSDRSLRGFPQNSQSAQFAVRCVRATD